MNELWYVLKLAGRKREIVGPLTAEELKEELTKGLTSWTDLAIRPYDDPGWRRLFDIGEFSKGLPFLPSPDKLRSYITRCRDHLDSSRPKSSGDRSDYPSVGPEDLESYHPTPRSPLYLRSQTTEHGPFEVKDLEAALRTLGMKHQIYIWYAGLQTWTPAQELPGFGHLRFENSAVRNHGGERTMLRALYGRETRSDERKPMVASVQVTKGSNENLFGVCINVSSTGMQIQLQSPSPVMPKEVVELEIIPFSRSGIPNLRARAQIIWWNSAEQRAGVFFLDFTADAKEQLLRYLSSVRPVLK